MIGELTLVWLGTMAALASVGMLIEMDRATNIIIPFVAAVFWGVMGLSAGEVAITDTDPVVTTAFEPVFWLGGVLALVCVAFGVYEMLFGATKTVEEAGEPDTFDL